MTDTITLRIPRETRIALEVLGFRVDMIAEAAALELINIGLDNISQQDLKRLMGTEPHIEFKHSTDGATQH
jgi:hypothetical protein